MEDLEVQENKLPIFQKIKQIQELENDFVFRCPFCGDSKDLNKGHLYISKKKPIFKCFKCNTGGHIYKIEELLNEKSNIIYTSTTVDDSFGCVDISKVTDNVDIILNNFSNLDNEKSSDYIKRRLNLFDLSLTHRHQFSIINSDFVKKEMQHLNDVDNRIWFMSAFGQLTIGRDIESSQLRYRNLKTNVPWQSKISYDCYMIKNDAFYRRDYPVDNLVITEGIFDIIPLYLNSNKYNINQTTSIFAAGLSQAHNRAEKVYKLLYNKIPKSIKIFSDNGVAYDTIINQFKDNKLSKIEVYYPENDKDWEHTPNIAFNFER